MVGEDYFKIFLISSLNLKNKDDYYKHLTKFILELRVSRR